MSSVTSGSSVPPRWSQQGTAPVTPGQVTRAKLAQPGTHPAAVVAMPLAPIPNGMIGG